MHMHIYIIEYRYICVIGVCVFVAISVKKYAMIKHCKYAGKCILNNPTAYFIT